MRYKWIDYTAGHASVIDGWLDDLALAYTGCDDGFACYYEYWENDVETEIGENFWAKVICDDGVPFAVMALADDGEKITISVLLVDPAKRSLGYGSGVLTELLTCGAEIISRDIVTAEAVIFPSNTSAQRAFVKAGFVFNHAHPDGDAWYYTYRNVKKPMTCYCGHDCARCVTYLATINNDGELRKQSQNFYRDTLKLNIELPSLHCLGGRGQDVFYLCGGCPWMRCCKERGLSACSECIQYPCGPLAEYRAKYVNKCNQIS